MAITIEEVRGRGGTNKALSRKYNVYGTSSEEDVLDAVYATAPASIAGLPIQGISLDEDEDVPEFYECVASYGSKQKDEPEVDAVEYRFSYQAPSVQIYQSLQTIYATSVPGGFGPPQFHGAINVVNDGSKQKVEGYNLAPPPTTFTLIYYPANATISTGYQTTVENLVGKVNSTTFKGRPAGSLMLTSVQGGARNNAGWSLELGFAYVANATDIPVGEMTIPSKDGMDLLWVFYGVDEDSSAKQLVQKPFAAYVERVFYRADLNALGI